MIKFIKFLIIFLIILVLVGFALVKCVPSPLGVTDKNVIQQANEFGIFEGLRVQRYIEKHAECPVMMEKWSSKSILPEYQYEIHVPINGKPGKSVPLRYKCTEGNDFLIWIRHSIDSDIEIKGGEGRVISIRYGHFTDIKKMEINTRMERKEVLQILRAEKLITSGST